MDVLVICFTQQNIGIHEKVYSVIGPWWARWSVGFQLWTILWLDSFGQSIQLIHENRDVFFGAVCPGQGQVGGNRLTVCNTEPVRLWRDDGMGGTVTAHLGRTGRCELCLLSWTGPTTPQCRLLVQHCAACHPSSGGTEASTSKRLENGQNWLVVNTTD